MQIYSYEKGHVNTTVQFCSTLLQYTTTVHYQSIYYLVIPGISMITVLTTSKTAGCIYTRIP